MRRHPPRFLIAASSILALSFVAASCGDTPSTPGVDDPWAAIAPDLQDACFADRAPGDDEPARDDYCRCIVLEFTEFYGTPEAFADAGGSVADGDRPVDPRVEPAVEGCAEQYLR